ncbi:spore cortex biosynthesis protein YabQ [Bacillus sinesaloumensis]|uniref:spore cortex biosynthesis protein YabQ n=1 Tax=Litchfieldia sinesaloumensis TaxID=1926280 RepID=UPI0009888111|nr:spore cortex biosynthesis protein YabQ [Bacillus sinesaloumensis]
MTLSTQFYTLLAMICMGGWLGASLDTYQRFLQRSRRKYFFVFINDILFWIVQGLLFFYTLLLVNEGELRFYVFIAILCGFAAYQSLLKTIYSRTLEHIIQAIIRLYEFLLRTGELLIIRPLKMLYQLVIVILLGILNVLLVFGRILLKVCWMILRIGFAPFKWVGILIWRLLPTAVTKNVEKIFSKCAGFLKKVENIVPILIKWWKKIRKK